MSAYEQMLKGNTPMLILSLLAERPMHGYAIAKEIGQRTADLLRFREGTLYPTLHEMEQKGWIEGRWESTNGGRERKVYTITPQGLRELQRQQHAWQRFRNAIEAVMQRKSPQSTEGGVELCTT
jgi:PadR family transcriptional regulator PadR